MGIELVRVGRLLRAAELASGQTATKSRRAKVLKQLYDESEFHEVRLHLTILTAFISGSAVGASLGDRSRGLCGG